MMDPSSVPDYTPKPRRPKRWLLPLLAAVIVLAGAGFGLRGSVSAFIHELIRPHPTESTVQQLAASGADGGAVFFAQDLPALVESAKTEAAFARARALIPYFDNRYYLNRLDAESLINLCAVYQNYVEFSGGCALPYPMEPDAYLNLMMLLEYECPELIHFQVNNCFPVSTNDDPLYEEIYPRYGLMKSRYEEVMPQTEALLDALCAETEGMTDYEKELFFYDYIIQHCNYSEEDVLGYSAYSVFTRGIARCEGICRAFKWAMDKCGIPCVCMTGIEDGAEVGHAWNAVQIDGKWYDLDATQDDAEPDGSQFPTPYGLVNISASWQRGRYPLMEPFVGDFTPPGTDSMADCYYAKLGLYAENEDDAIDLLYSQLNSAYSGDGGRVSLQLSDEALFETIFDRLQPLVKDWLNSSGIYWISYTYYSYPASCVILLDVTF
ncbi:MAG: transglutaminase domain-containing protein [Hominenteromicrobium sp.]